MYARNKKRIKVPCGHNSFTPQPQWELLLCPGLATISWLKTPMQRTTPVLRVFSPSPLVFFSHAKLTLYALVCPALVPWALRGWIRQQYVPYIIHLNKALSVMWLNKWYEFADTTPTTRKNSTPRKSKTSSVIQAKFGCEARFSSKETCVQRTRRRVMNVIIVNIGQG